jgi:MFS family permease
VTTATAERKASTSGGGLRAEERHRLLILGLPTFGMALCITAVSSYVPVIARDFEASTLIIGLIVGAEGVMALWLPVVVGSRSDRLRTSLGGRIPFVLAGTPVMMVCLAVVGFVGSVIAVAVVVALFFAGYFVSYEPYRALYPDLLRDQVASRSQATQAGFRGLGTLVALASGGALLSVATAAPFLLYAALLGLSVGTFAWLILRSEMRDPGEGSAEAPRAREAFRRVASLLREHPALRLFVVANALWELSLGALKTFVVLYVTAGLGYQLGEASLIIGAVAVIILGGALIGGRIADRLGRLRVTEWALWIYGVALIVPGLFTAPAAILAAVPFVALGGGLVMSLPYSLLMPLMPQDEHGLLTGVYSVSRGIGVMLGPLVAGLAITLAEPLFSSTDGYAATWLVCSAAVLLSIPLLRAMRGQVDDRRELRGGS